MAPVILRQSARSIISELYRELTRPLFIRIRFYRLHSRQIPDMSVSLVFIFSTWPRWGLASSVCFGPKTELIIDQPSSFVQVMVGFLFVCCCFVPLHPLSKNTCQFGGGKQIFLIPTSRFFAHKKNVSDARGVVVIFNIKIMEKGSKIVYRLW